MSRLTTAVEDYFTGLRQVRASGGATGERSSYLPLGNLLNAVGATLKPKTFCISELADQGAGHPDFGLYAARQVQKGRPKEGQIPERGVVEVKPADDDAWQTADSDQVSRYWDRYRLVLVTNTRDLILIGEDAAGGPAKLEGFRISNNAEEFDRLLETPRKLAHKVSVGLIEYLVRALSHRARLAEPKDLAWLLASHARDALARVEAAGDAPSLAAVQAALEEALGVRFEGEKGARFFHSTLVQTLFYGVFVVRYMVARVDKALKEDLDIPDGLAADNVYVLDPCCGTGAYLAEVLRCIAANLENRGLGALAGARVKEAATRRVFGFEIMPAPFVVAHLQVGLTMQEIDAALSDDGKERAQVFLTNALTGWEPRATKPLPFPELEEERDRAERVKRETPILVILGNPPYNGYAGMAVDEERELSEAYRMTKRVRRPEGQGLNDLYVRFFRMAERRIARTGQGVVCFISNYSWLDGLSFTGMRERYLEAFDAIRIDCLNGDKYKTGKVAPDGSPDPSIFSTESDPVGIQVGTAITTLVRNAAHVPTEEIGFRHLWGQAKREELIKTEEVEPGKLYENIKPVLPLGLPFVQTAVSEDWFNWPTLPDLFPVSFPGVKTSRDSFLVDTDLDRLKKRIGDYFDGNLSHDEITQRYPGTIKSPALRDALLERGGPIDANFIRFSYRPFDIRWLYWEAESSLLDRPRPDYRRHVFGGNMWLSAAQHLRKGAEEPQTYSTEYIASLHLIERGTNMFPAYLCDEGFGINGNEIQRRPNLSSAAQLYLHSLGADVEDLFHHVLATLHDSTYREANAGALSMGWPRIPLPAWPDGNNAQASDLLARSAARGRELAALLDPETPVPGITTGTLHPEVTVLAVPATAGGRNMTGKDFELTADWGHYGTGKAVMPGQGYTVEREYTPDERTTLGAVIPTLGEETLDVYLNKRAFWRNVPAAIWNYKLGGYQVLKKWLSYREQAILDRPLLPEEVMYFTEIARRIAMIITTTKKSTESLTKEGS